MSSNKLTDKLINQLREKIKYSYAYNMYNCKDEKDKWSIICSAMDWIQVAINGIDFDKFEKNRGLEDSVRMITIISCIDILWEGIQQLHRVFFNTDEIPFKDENSKFKNKLKNVSDNEYWKTIRACFAAHPINIKYLLENSNEEKHYASWSCSGIGSADFSVLIYSNKPNSGHIYLGIYFNELMDFAIQRYNYLENILTEIDKQSGEYILNLKKKIIAKKREPLEQIEILFTENENRFGSDCYEYELKEIRRIFSTYITDENNRILVEKLRNQLLLKLDEIFNNLQNMECLELKSIADIPSPGGYSYVFSRLSGYVDGSYSYHEFSPFKSELLDRLERELGDMINFSQWDSYDELYVISQAGLFFKEK